MVWDDQIHGPLFRCFVTLEVRGIENLENLSPINGISTLTNLSSADNAQKKKSDVLNGPVFFIANHLSYIDQPSVMSALPREIRYRTATAAWQEFFFGGYRGFNRILRRLCFEYGTVLFNLFPLPQSKGFSGSLAYMGKLADAGVNILIFPEGEHSRNGNLLPFQLGLGIMVKELGVPVVPIKISGTGQVLPPGARFPKPGKVTVTFGEPLRFRYEEPAEIVEKARQAVEKL